MAVVRITKELTDYITQNARRKFNTALDNARNAKPEDKWGDYIYDKLFGEHYHTMKQLPSNFFEYKNAIDIRHVSGVNISMTFSLSEAKPFPRALPMGDDNPLAKTWWSGHSYDLKHDLVWGELYAEVKAWNDKVDRILRQQHEFVEGVGKVLSEFSTLAPALKAWPPLWELVPEYVQNKHKEIVVREKKTKPSIDTNTIGKLSGVMAASKLGGL